MSQHEKLLNKANRNPSGLSFSEFQTLMHDVDGKMITKGGVTRFGIRLKVREYRFRTVKEWPKNTRFGSFLRGYRRVMMIHDEFDGFSIELFQDEEGEWLAHFAELPNVSAFGETLEEALQELKEAWAAMKESYAKHNEPIPVAPAKKEYSGQFNVRIDRRVHRALAIEAAQAGISLNALVAQKLSLASRDYLKTPH